MKNILTMLGVELEYSRLAFLFDRDGISEVERFARQTEKIYKQHILQKKYWKSSRRRFVISYLEFRKVRKYFDLTV